MKTFRFGTRMAAAGLAMSTTIAVVAFAATSPQAAAQQKAPAGGPVRTITLVTGDRVVVSDTGQPTSVEAGPGRAGVAFDIVTARGRASVIPSDVRELLAGGRLDPRLFDVAELLAAGHDRPDDGLRLIVTGAEASLSNVDGLVKVRELPAVNGFAVRQARDQAAKSWRALAQGALGNASRAGAGKVWLDAKLRPTLDTSVRQIGAPAAWDAGYNGAGSTVAVLDTGIDDSHPDLAGQVVARRNFTEDSEPDNDLSGHGTHVAAIIAGTGAGSGGRYTGVAPGTKLLDGKVCTRSGCDESWIVAGMTWAAAEQHAKVVNMSLGGQDDPEATDPVEAAVQTLTEQYGTLFVVAAGNSDGSVVEGQISSPGSAEAALTVGAVDDAGAVADFSRRGPRAPDEGLKPDITAPGVDITVARGKDATEVPGASGDRYTTLSGTSMATPHVAGAAAILAQQHTDWSGQRLKAALTASAQPEPGTGVFAQGGGRVDVGRAIRQTVTSSPVGVSFGKQLWPHDDDEVLRRDVTYRNHGAADVNLSLRAVVHGPGGASVPDGMFTLSTTSLSVPARGEATIMVTVDTRVAGPDGYLGGWLTATAGDLVTRTAIAVHKEVESYDITLAHLDRAGSPASSFITQIASHGIGPNITWFGGASDNPLKLRLPKAHYVLISSIQVRETKPSTQAAGASADSYVALLAQPDLYLDRAMTVDLDARLAQPISVTLPRSSPVQFAAQLGASMDRSEPRGAGITVLAKSFATLYSARLGPEQHNDNFSSGVVGQWAQPGPDGTLFNSPEVYALHFQEPGRMIHGYDRRVTDKELVPVHADIAFANPGMIGRKTINTAVGDSGGFGPELEFQLPFRRIEYYYTGIEALSSLREQSLEGNDFSFQRGSFIRYRPGQTYHERWNRGVFGPAVPKNVSWEGATRTGDQINLELQLYTDAHGRMGHSTADQTLTLFRDGVKFAEMVAYRFVTIDVPPAEANYRLEVSARRDAPFALSTSSNVAWTFRSGHVSSAEPVPLPLWTVQFTPGVDRYNALPANGIHAIPMVVAKQEGSQPGRPAAVTVAASFDDGATWTPVRVFGTVALVRHPSGTGFVSLRAAVTDSNGNTVEQTTIRAYRFGSVR